MSDQPASPQLTSAITQIFQNTVTNRHIRFRIGSIQVAPERLVDVGSAISRGDINVVLGQTSSGSNAQYDPRANLLRLTNPDVSDPRARGLIVHEGVHAANDILARATNRLDDEVAAFLAQAVYLRTNSPWHRNRSFQADGTAAGNLRAALMPVADHVMCGRAIQPRQLTRLRQAVLSTPNYIGIDGLSVRYDGV